MKEEQKHTAMFSPSTHTLHHNTTCSNSTCCSDLDAVIIGSGFAGIYQAIELKKNGIHNFLILEKESDLGGT
jgi:heterodisulfide reductase subunit A-like polyferredoxin